MYVIYIDCLLAYTYTTLPTPQRYSTVGIRTYVDLHTEIIDEILFDWMFMFMTIK